MKKRRSSTQDWYVPLPAGEDLPPPAVSGALLFRISLLIEGLALTMLGLVGRQFRRLEPAERLSVKEPPQQEKALSRRTALRLLGAVALMALAFRLWRLDSELWLDELTPRLAYGRASALQFWVSYRSSNSHLLNDLLVKLSVALWGEKEWAIRITITVDGKASANKKTISSYARWRRWTLFSLLTQEPTRFSQPPSPGLCGSAILIWLEKSTALPTRCALFQPPWATEGSRCGGRELKAETKPGQ